MPLGAPLLQLRRVRRQVFLSAVHDPAHITPDVEAGYFRPLHMRGHFHALGRQLISRQDDELESPEGISQPTFILWGEHDAWLRPEFGETLAGQIPNAELTLVPSAGHLPLEEQPDFCNREILRFLQEDEQPPVAETSETKTETETVS